MGSAAAPPLARRHVAIPYVATPPIQPVNDDEEVYEDLEQEKVRQCRVEISITSQLAGLF